MNFYALKLELAERIAHHWNHPEIDARTVFEEFTAPPNVAMGHLALPCFRLAKTLGKQTHVAAKELATELSNPELTVTAAGPYANIRWNPALLSRGVLQEIFRMQNKYGSDTSGKGKTILIEYCSPNIAKRLAFQHIRSTLLGNTLANIYDCLGYETVRLNFVGDWGSQFARLLAAVEMWSSAEKLAAAPPEEAMKELFEVYVRFHKSEDSDPGYAERASRCLQSLESEDERALKLWKQIRDLSLQSMQKTLDRMGIRFDHVEGESQYVRGMNEVLEDVKKRADARLSEGAWIVEVEGISTPALVQKRDGTTLYLTRDIAAAIDRRKRFKFDRMFYVVSEQQKLHFQLLFGVLKKMGYDWADECAHLSFGTVLFGSEKMSTREGRVIFLEDLLDEAKRRALAVCSEKNPDLVNKEEVAEQVGIGAILFGELSANRTRDIEFNWEHILAFDGETGPYVQYSLVRCHSLLEKAKAVLPSPESAKVPANYEIGTEEEWLVLCLSKLGDALHQAIRENEPHHLTRYLIEVAKAFNRFYYRFPVLQAGDTELRDFRLQLVRATSQVLKNGLDLLGIQCPKEM